MESLFGGMPDAARFVVAFMLVLGLIGAGALLWRRFGAGPLSSVGPRNRHPRLAVVEAAFVDARRRLVLIKRDNTEHLLMIGGPTDIVVESNIARAGALVSREPRPIPDSSRQSAPNDGPDWTLPLEPMTRPMRADGDVDAGFPEPPPRSAREAMVDSMRAARSAPQARRNSGAEFDTSPEDDITALAPTPPSSPAEANHRAAAVTEARRASSAPEPQRLQPTPDINSPSSEAAAAKRTAAPAPRPAQSEDNNLAEMAQRLEAALRRPTKPIESPAPPPPAAARAPTRSEPAATRKPANLDSVGAPKGGGKLPEPVSSPPPELKILSGKAKSEPPPLESLEDEMAKMLGRAPRKS